MSTKSIFCCVIVGALLGACGGSSANEPSQATSATEVQAGEPLINLRSGGDWIAPIVHDFTRAGRYTLTMTGQLQVAGAGDALISFDLSGSGTISGGAAQQSYQITAASGQMITINRTITLDLTGAGPWQMRTKIQTFGTGGTLTNIQLNIAS